MASTSKFIRRTEGGAAKDPGAPVATPPATAAKVDKARKAPAATTQPTKRTATQDNTMMDYYNNSNTLPTTTKTNDKSKLVPLKKKKTTKFKSGQAITKAAQGRS